MRVLRFRSVAWLLLCMMVLVTGKTKLYNPSDNVSTLYQGYIYNDWGGVVSETEPLPEEQWEQRHR